jgi:quinolinate synthase
MTPEIFHCVADITGDSLALAREAMRVQADIIVMAGVHFMAETAKMLNPQKTVLIPSLEAGCSLASSITAADVRQLRQKYPGRPVITYVNTSAEVKAESDICCTSGNARRVVESLGVPEVIMIPDRYLAHPECPPAVVDEADFAGSTAAMSDYVTRKQPARVVLITECSMADNIAVQHPTLDVLRPCNLCPHMKRITLPGLRACLETLTHEITLDPAIAARARAAVERMLAL